MLPILPPQSMPRAFYARAEKTSLCPVHTLCCSAQPSIAASSNFSIFLVFLLCIVRMKESPYHRKYDVLLTCMPCSNGKLGNLSRSSHSLAPSFDSFLPLPILAPLLTRSLKFVRNPKSEMLVLSFSRKSVASSDVILNYSQMTALLANGTSWVWQYSAALYSRVPL